MNEEIAITTAKFDHLAEEAQKLGAYYGINYIARGNKGINKLMNMHDLDNMLVLSAEGLTAYAINQEEKLRFHPGMAVARLRLANDELKEPLLRAVEPFGGMRILDCTLGLASDAVSLAVHIGEEGRIMGLEETKTLYNVKD